MPVLDYLWVLLGILLSVQQSLSLYTEAKTRATLLRHILLDDIYSVKQKRTHVPEQKHRSVQRFALRECCPSTTQGIAPLGGISRDGALLQLLRDAATFQKFYETSCVPGIHGMPCRYINETYAFSRCEQRYTFTYAIVKDFNVTQPYRFDYIKIKSGCACVVGEPTLDIL